MICLLNYICLLKDINIYLYRFILWWNLQFIIWSFTICPSPFAQILKLWPVIALSFFNTLISFMLYYFILRLALPQSLRCWDYKCTQLCLTMVALSFLKICLIHFMLCDFSLRLDWTSWSSCLSLPDAGIMGIHCHSCSLLVRSQCILICSYDLGLYFVKSCAFPFIFHISTFLGY